MTPEGLEALILAAGDPWEIQRAFAGLDEKARAKLSTPAQRIHRQLNTYKALETASEALKQLLASREKDRWNFYSSRENRNANLALFAVGPLSAVKKRLFVWNEQEVLERILQDRRPPWLDEWIAHDLEQEFGTLNFPTVRAWVRAGICVSPTVDGYYSKFAAYLMRTHDYGDRTSPVPPITLQLLADPGMLDDIPGLFRVETIAFNTNSWLKAGAAPDHETWTEALVKLSAQKRVDRGELLRLALDGLRRDVKENQLSGLHRFYVAMGPTDEELLAHQPDYIDLLCHPVGHVAKFAIEMLVKVEKLGRLEVRPVLREAPGMFAREGKGNALAALKLLERIAARGEGEAALSTVAEALRHANADVQAKALALLEARAGALSSDLRAQIARTEGFVAASNRGRLRALAGEAVEAAPALEEPILAAEDEGPVLTELGGVLSDETRLPPIVTLEVLIDAVLHAIEVVSSPDQVELIVDGISRLAGQHPADFADRVAPVLHRLKNGRAGANGLGAAYGGVGLALLDVIFSWATGRLHHTTSPHSQYYADEAAFEPMIIHLRAVAEAVARREARPLLSAPTHKGGWIDPVVWVERLRTQGGAPGLEHTMDLRLSLLRLAPERRAEALEATAGLQGPVRRLAVFALGGEEAPVRADRGAHAAWISAARCRAPLADWTAAFVPLDLDDVAPGSLRPAEHRWRSAHRLQQYDKQSWKLPDFQLSVGFLDEAVVYASPKSLFARLLGPVQGKQAINWRAVPSAALSHLGEEKRYYSGDLNTTWVAQWLAYIWPQNPTGAWMKAARKLMERIDENSSSWSPGHGFLQSLFQPGRPWGEAGHLLLCLGLIGKDADVKGLAVDALIEGIDGRRFDPALFAAVMTRLCAGEWVKLNRPGEALLQAAQVSGRHARVVSEALQAWLPSLDLEARGAFQVLEVLAETQAITGAPLSEPTAAKLRTARGSGKAGKLAKAMLAGG